MKLETKICLGSAQFGLNYGITNTKGKLGFEEVKKIIACANNMGIDCIDTAQDYGDAEKVIGSCMQSKRNMKIISKLKSHRKSNFIKEDIKLLQNDLEESLKNLKVSELECLLLHNENDLLREGNSFLLEWIDKIKQRGLIKNFGVSIYNFKKVDQIKKLNLDIIQLPLSIYDRNNFESGFIDSLNNIPLKIQVRSIYLQGIILSKPNRLPDWIEKSDYESHFLFQNELRRYGITPIQAAINYVKSIKRIHTVVIGITSIRELEEFNEIWNKDFNFDLFKTLNLPLFSKKILDPRQWPIK